MLVNHSVLCYDKSIDESELAFPRIMTVVG